jgi:hypothetical protein
LKHHFQLEFTLSAPFESLEGVSTTPAYFFFFFQKNKKIKNVIGAFGEKNVKVVELPQFENVEGVKCHI